DEFQQEQDRWQDASEQEKTDLLNRAQNLEREAARLETRGQAFEQDRSNWESQRRQTETALAVHQQELVGQRAELNQARQQLESGQPRHGLQRSAATAPASAGAPVRRRQPKRVSRPAPADVPPSRPVMADYRIVAVAAGLLCAVGAAWATWFALESEYTAVDHASTNHVVDVRPNPHARQLEAVDRDVAQYERQLESRRNEHALLVPETLVVRHQLALQQIRKTSTELGQVQSRHKLAEKERDERKVDLGTDLQASFSDAELDAQLRLDAVAFPLLVRLDDLEKKKSEIKATAAPAVLARYLESCQRDLDATTARLNERRDALRAELQAQAQESIRAELQQSQEGIAALKDKERQLQDELQEQELEVKDIEGRVARAAAMQEDIRRLETQLNDSLAERERLDVPVHDSSVSSTEPPTIKDRGSFSSRHLLTTLAVVVAFLIPLLGITWWTARTGRAPRPLAER
ncbi:MAG: hypothetical protein HQ581_13240, partial [Planctomycetes bacterium]|nr:hypothetical protein [Planctomycetota bacterium]